MIAAFPSFDNVVDKYFTNTSPDASLQQRPISKTNELCSEKEYNIFYFIEIPVIMPLAILYSVQQPQIKNPNRYFWVPTVYFYHDA